MPYKITKIKMSSGGTTEEHIDAVKCISDGAAKETEESVAEVIKWLPTISYYVTVDGNKIDVTKSTSAAGREYIKTKPDDTKKDNLLSLPRF